VGLGPGPCPGCAALRADVVRLAGRVSALEQQQPRRPLSRADVATLVRLLPVLGATYGDEGFTSRDCVEDAADEAHGLRLVLGQMSAKAIGKLLARANGIAIDSLMVRCQRKEFQVSVWQVVAC